jgi:hypothetical protein
MKLPSLACTLLVLSLAASSVGCKSRPKPAAAPVQPAATSQSTSSAAAAIATILIRAKDATAGRIERKGDTWMLSADGMESVTCKAHDARKSRCQAASGAAVAEIKFHADDTPGEGSIKLLSADGALQWKLRFSPEKIKISNNEENRDAWTLSLKHEDKIKVEDPRDQEVGAYRRSDGDGKVKNLTGDTLFTIDGAGKSAFPALLLVPVLMPRERLILAAELLAHGL